MADPAYGTLPKLPIALDWSSVPELIRVASLDLGGIQPVTKAMAEAAGGTLHDKPSDGEVELFRKRGTNFQLVSIVLSSVPAGEVDGVLQVRPFAMTLIRASKWDKDQESTIDLVAKLGRDQIGRVGEIIPECGRHRAESAHGDFTSELVGFTWNCNSSDGFCDEVKVAPMAIETEIYRRNPPYRVFEFGETIRRRP